jgi:hypothetical protein
MKKFIVLFGSLALLLGATTIFSQDAPFGDPVSVKYSKKLWNVLKKERLIGPDAIFSKPYKGTHPHGAVLDTINSRVTVRGHNGLVFVKRNYGGEGATVASVSTDPAKHLKAITVMFQREDGYDSDNQNWFWAKYLVDGSLDKNPKGMALAGRVAKGKSKGCIACHTAAPGGDYLFLK